MDFGEDGPRLGRIDWSNGDHRRIVAACLTKGAYVKRTDIKSKVDGTAQALAPPWWINLRFKPSVRVLTDSFTPCFGIIYEFDESDSRQRGDISVEKAPRFVVAVRGTQSLLDAALDTALSLQKLQRCRRVNKAYDEVRRIATTQNVMGTDVWLTGHSLGASIATVVGMELLRKEGIRLETFLFNPPYLRLDPVTLKHGTVRFLISNLQKMLANLLHGYMTEAADYSPESALTEWKPRLFVNPNDYISKGFIEYFKHKDTLFKGMRPANLLRVQRPDGRLMDLDLPLLFGVGKCPVFLIQSGTLTSNVTETTAGSSHRGRLITGEIKKLLAAHTLSQWWKKDQNLIHEEYE